MSIQSAIDTVETMTALAKRLGVSYQAVQKWVANGVPVERCAAVEAATGVRCEELRPDVAWLRNEAGEVTGYQVPIRAA